MFLSLRCSKCWASGKTLRRTSFRTIICYCSIIFLDRGLFPLCNEFQRKSNSVATNSSGSPKRFSHSFSTIRSFTKTSLAQRENVFHCYYHRIPPSRLFQSSSRTRALYGLKAVPVPGLEKTAPDYLVPKVLLSSLLNVSMSNKDSMRRDDHRLLLYDIFHFTLSLKR